MRISVCAVNLVARRFLLISLSSASLLVLRVRGDENYFGYSYGSETLPKGKWELYSWTTGSFGKGTGSYSASDRKQEVEYGGTDRFQIALEWKENHTYFTGGAGQEMRTQIHWRGGISHHLLFHGHPSRCAKTTGGFYKLPRTLDTEQALSSYFCF